MDFQPIQPIQMLWSTPLAGGTEERRGAAQPSLFSDVFQSLLDNVRETDAEKNKKEFLLATGQLDNPAEWSIAASQYQAAVTLLVQMRNKALDAYSEIMRMSV